MTSEGFEGEFGLGVDAGEYEKAHVLDGIRAKGYLTSTV
jgi:hypothetical protein